MTRHALWLCGGFSIHALLATAVLNTFEPVNCFQAVHTAFHHAAAVAVQRKTTRTTPRSSSSSSFLLVRQASETPNDDTTDNAAPPQTPPPTLREFVTDSSGFHLAMGPSFFGFYAYFGALVSLNENVLQDNHGAAHFLVPPQEIPISKTSQQSQLSSPQFYVKSVGGASAGAMAAGLLAAGCNPRDAADFACSLNLSSFADPPGWGGLLRGKKFERLLENLLEEQPSPKMRLEDAIIPLAVSVYDIGRHQTKILQHGNMARAIRASSTYPQLFQPVVWNPKRETITTTKSKSKSSRLSRQMSFLIDGGVHDNLGLLSLTNNLLPVDDDFSSDTKYTQHQLPQERVLNLNVGTYQKRYGEGPPPGPSDVSSLLYNFVDSTTTTADKDKQHNSKKRPAVVKELVSMTIENVPKCGPFAMDNGPKAVEAARLAVLNHLDVPMTRGKEPGHYELHIDASVFSKG